MKRFYLSLKRDYIIGMTGCKKLGITPLHAFLFLRYETLIINDLRDPINNRFAYVECSKFTPNHVLTCCTTQASKMKYLNPSRLYAVAISWPCHWLRTRYIVPDIAKLTSLHGVESQCRLCHPLLAMIKQRTQQVQSALGVRALICSFQISRLVDYCVPVDDSHPMCRSLLLLVCNLNRHV